MPVARACDGTAIFYERSDPLNADAGSRGLLAIGPLGLDSRLWRLVTPDAIAGGYTVLAADNRGCGRSKMPSRPWSLRTMAEDLVSVLDDAGFQRVHVCGPSLGGMVAQELAITHRDRVGALVLAATTPSLPRLDLLPYPAIAGALLTPAARMLGPRAPEARTRRLLRVLISPELAGSTHPGSPLWDLAEELSENPPSVGGLLWQLVAAGTSVLWHRLSRIRAPTLIVHGTRDRIIPARAAGVLARKIPGARVELIEGAGHALVLERPQEVTEKALRFIGAHDGLLSA
jgi:3-oxoadipate enol-lactonase